MRSLPVPGGPKERGHEAEGGAALAPYQKQRRFSRALVTMQRADGLSLIDGTHRMAAFVMFQGLSDAQLAQVNVQRPSVEQDVWQGVHPNGELPDW